MVYNGINCFFRSHPRSEIISHDISMYLGLAAKRKMLSFNYIRSCDVVVAKPLYMDY